MSTSPAYAYGRFLGAWHNAINEFLQQVHAGFRDVTQHAALVQSQPTTEEARERRSEALYRLRVEEERRRGQRYVSSLIARTRRDLGLPPT